ncbi:hypothetical protein N9P41_02530 [Pseudomonadales bacterium]|jgi:hypothetical protein|nr:hypothetical protein [Pseudomonadales bacterium]MDB0050291.1 hypothetical protein [Pseudomonadales bacterium]MDB2646022.1 hypothetical protein [Pseudomonadales bacterium]
MKKPAKNHPWKLGLSGPVSYATKGSGNWHGFYSPPEAASPVKTLSPSEIKELGLELVIPVAEIQEARRMCQKLHPDRGGDPEAFQMWKEKLDRLKRRVRR